MSDQINDKPTLVDIIKRFSEVTDLSIEEAEQKIGAATEAQILKNIEEYTLKKINEKMPQLNRAQRRMLAKKQKKQKGLSKEAVEAIADTTKKINYIDLIQKLQKLNEKNKGENENYEDEDEGN